MSTNTVATLTRTVFIVLTSRRSIQLENLKRFRNLSSMDEDLYVVSVESIAVALVLRANDVRPLQAAFNSH